MSVAANAETRGFETEVNQLLDLMIHSLYSNKDIFLRELVSNASDACDRLRFSAVSDGSLYEEDIELKIRVSYDKDNRTVTISDNGIGMTRDEVIDHIGTISPVPVLLIHGTLDIVVPFNHAEEMLAALKQWCVDAEATGIQALDEFVADLRTYSMPKSAAV